MENAGLRGSLVLQAEAAFFSLTQQVDQLLELATFYLDRYPPDGTMRDRLVATELMITANNLAGLVNQLAETVAGWKDGRARVLSRTGTEISIINELRANCSALMYFLLSNGIDIDALVAGRLSDSFDDLLRCNRLLT